MTLPYFSKKVRKNLILNLIIPLGTVGLSLAIMPGHHIFQFSGDEGNQMAKVSLLKQGFKLYQEIWSDQPPLHTFFLFHWLNLWGFSLVNARLMTLTFSATLVWSFSQIINDTVGLFPALLSAVFLILSSDYLVLSQGVLIGLPGITLGVISLYFLLKYEQHQRIIFIVISGLFLAASLQIKWINIILVFSFLGRFFLGNQKHNRFQRIGIWLLCIFAGFIILGLAFNAFHWEQLLSPHLQARNNADLGWRYSPGLSPFFTILCQDYDYLLLFLIGLGVIISQGRNALFPLSWMLTSSIILGKHRPLWFHYYPFLSLPMIWIMAYGMKGIFQWFKKGNHDVLWSSPKSQFKGKRIVNSSLAILFSLALIMPLVGIPIRIQQHHQRYEKLVQKSELYWDMLNQIEIHASPGNQWLLTDIPLYGFLSSLEVPPLMATVSSKRFNTGHLTTEDIEEILTQYQPSQIVLGRSQELLMLLRDKLEQNYQLVYKNERLSQYLQRNHEHFNE